MELFELSTWSELIFEALSIIVLGLSAFAMKRLTGWLKSKGIAEEIVAKEELALIVVGFVEQAYTYLEGEEKLKIAVATLADRMKQYGFNVNSDEIEELIEDAVHQMNDIWVDEIYNLEDV